MEGAPRRGPLLGPGAPGWLNRRSSPKKAKMASARSAIIAACGQPSSSHFTHLNGPATVTGVGFFDIPHGQTGVAPNAIELHPVLKFSAAAC